MDKELKDAFESEFYISTNSKTPECKLWHGLGIHICPEGISIFNVDVDKISSYGPVPPCIETLKKVLKAHDFKRIKGENKWTIRSNIDNYNKAIPILQYFDRKMDPETKKMHYEGYSGFRF